MVGFGGIFKVSCYDKHGKLKWFESDRKNVVTQVGRRYANNTALAASAQIATWYVGLMDGTPTIASTDVASNHGGWTEFVLYDEGTRPSFTAVGSLDEVGNNASKASFALATTSDLGGAFIISDSEKGATNGSMWAGASFSANKSIGPSDTITIEYTTAVTSS